MGLFQYVRGGKLFSTVSIYVNLSVYCEYRCDEVLSFQRKIQRFPHCLLHSPTRLHCTHVNTVIEMCPSSPHLLAARPCCNSTQLKLTLKKSRFPPSLQNRRNLSDRVLSIFLTKIMAANFHFNGSGRLGREMKFVPRGRSSVKNKERIRVGKVYPHRPF